MKNVLIFFAISMFLFSCKTQKNTINENIKDITKNDSIYHLDTVILSDMDSDGDGFIDQIDKCPTDFGLDSGCPTVSKLVLESNEKISEDKSKLNQSINIPKIRTHEKKTKLKVIDRTSKKNEANKGWIAYSVPEQMQVAKSYSVKVRISKKDGQSKAQLILGDYDAINNPQYPSIATIEDVKVSGEMSAELRGDVSTFKIVALSTPLQNIDNESYTEWEWVVTPLKGGQSPLKLVVMLKDLNKDIVVFNRFIQVKTNVPVAVEGFFEKYWQWFMTTIIIPVFIYFWNRKKKRKTKKS